MMSERATSVRTGEMGLPATGTRTTIGGPRRGLGASASGALASAGERGGS